jgi:hypothetical protein
MGFFKKAKDAAAAVHVRGAGLIDPAILGGPSTRSVAADDPIWAPINGVSLQEGGWDPVDTKAALDGWVQRMGQSMAVGQQFRKCLGY